MGMLRWCTEKREAPKRMQSIAQAMPPKPKADAKADYFLEKLKKLADEASDAGYCLDVHYIPGHPYPVIGVAKDLFTIQKNLTKQSS
jgi:hypothetical protein